MAKLNIPDRVVSILAEILKFSEKEVLHLKKALSEAKPGLNPEIIEKSIPKNLREDSSNLNKVINAFLNLNAARIENGSHESEFIKDVGQAIKEKLKLDDSDEIIQIRLTEFMNIPSLVLSARSMVVQAEHNNIFYHAKIISDIRPVFDEVGISPLATILVHNFKIHYHSDNEHKEIYFALDSSDLLELRKILERAEKKDKALRTLINNIKLEAL